MRTDWIVQERLVRTTVDRAGSRCDAGARMLLIAAMGLGGCRAGVRTDSISAPVEIYRPMTIAVAPAINLSGSTDFDPARFGDLMASELGHAAGIRVIPVSRVLGVLGAQGVDSVESMTHALELVTLLGADAILVFSVNEYDPFEPPSIGITAQLYGVQPGTRVGHQDAAELSRYTAAAAQPGGPRPRGLLSSTQRVFDASHDAVVEEIRRFAAERDADASPFGWRKYVVSQQAFIRFCCHATLSQLLHEQLGHRAQGAGGSAPEVGGDGDSTALAGQG